MTKIDLSNSLIVIGYPRNGNTWLSRLLGDALDSPVTGLHYAVPLATEGQNRQGDYVIRQLHLRPDYGKCHMLIPNAYTFSVRCYNDEKVINVVRDPRDVVVSTKFYWDIPTMQQALTAVGNGVHPVKTHGPWSRYVSEWMDCQIQNKLTVRYEDMHTDAVKVLRTIFWHWGIPYDENRLEEAVERQSFDNRKRDIQLNFPHLKQVSGMSYNRSIQLKNLRRGEVGNWKRYFTRQMGKMAQECFGELMALFGYIDNKDWWKELKE